MFYYKIKVFSEFDGNEEVCEGITTGETYTQAFENIESEYGKEYIEEIHFLAPLVGEGDGLCIELNELKENLTNYGVNYGERAKEVEN